MEPKKRRIFVTAIALTVIVGVVASFGLPFFSAPKQINLPGLSGDGAESGIGYYDGEGNYIRVEVTAETVQNMIASLHRSDSYYRELSVETAWGSGAQERSDELPVYVWTDGETQLVKRQMEDDSWQHQLIIGDAAYLWYEGDSAWFAYTASDETANDLAQKIPTYETVLAWNKGDIISAGYEMRQEQSCIFIEANSRVGGYTEQYWISVQSGLLVAVTREKDGIVVYQMTEKIIKPLDDAPEKPNLPSARTLEEFLRSGEVSQ